MIHINHIYHINDTFRILNGFSEENIKEGFKENIDIVVPITENFKEKFIEMMLSSELKVILNYNQLHIGLPLNSNKSIKLKV
jgi:hypothetical protein